MSAGLARLKQGVRGAIALAGGIDGAAATVDRGRSVVGDWNNLNTGTFPTIDKALMLDEVAIALGHVPAILRRYASEVGYAVFRLPNVDGVEGALAGEMISASAEFGDIASAVRDATADGATDAREAERIVSEIDQAMASLVRLRAVAAALSGGKACANVERIAA